MFIMLVRWQPYELWRCCRAGKLENRRSAAGTNFPKVMTAFWWQGGHFCESISSDDVNLFSLVCSSYVSTSAACVEFFFHVISNVVRREFFSRCYRG